MLPPVFISTTSGVTPTISISNKFPVDGGASPLGTIHFLFFSCHFPFRSNNVEPRNQTDISEFFLLGLTDKPDLQPLLLSVPVHVFDHCLGKPAHHPGCHLWLAPPHLHVILSFQALLYWYLYKHCHNPKDAGQQPSTNTAHHSHRLPHPDWFCSGFWWCGECSPCSNGLWSLSGHLLPLEVHSYHEPPTLCSADATFTVY